jgi:signal transduction histidine kinase
LRSLRPTARAAAEIDGSDLQRRLPEERVVKELLPSVRAFNAALQRVADAFERRRRFVADLAHELRTPIAMLNMHVEEMPPNGKKPDMQRTVFRLSQMVGQMLDADRLALSGRRRDRVDLVQLARDAAAGLGLHLVREIMQAHGGRARLVHPGPGATFRLDFSA